MMHQEARAFQIITITITAILVATSILRLLLFDLLVTLVIEIISTIPHPTLTNLTFVILIPLTRVVQVQETRPLFTIRSISKGNFSKPFHLKTSPYMNISHKHPNLFRCFRHSTSRCQLIQKHAQFVANVVLSGLSPSVPILCASVAPLNCSSCAIHFPALSAVLRSPKYAYCTYLIIIIIMCSNT